MLNFPQSAAFLVLVSLMLPAASAQDPDPVEDDGTVSVEFSGGSVAEYVTALKEKREGINVVVDPEAAAIVMPAVSLKRALVADALYLIQQIAVGRNINLLVNRVGNRNRQNVRPARRGAKANANEIETDVYVITYQGRRKRKSLRIFSLKDFPTEGEQASKEDAQAERVLKAIDAALGLAVTSEKDKATVTFHSDSRLLMVSGTDREISVVDQVLEAMRRLRAPGKDEVKQLRREIQKLREAIAELEKNATAGKESEK